MTVVVDRRRDQSVFHANEHQPHRTEINHRAGLTSGSAQHTATPHPACAIFSVRVRSNFDVSINYVVWDSSCFSQLNSHLAEALDMVHDIESRDFIGRSRPNRIQVNSEHASCFSAIPKSDSQWPFQRFLQFTHSRGRTIDAF